MSASACWLICLALRADFSRSPNLTIRTPPHSQLLPFTKLRPFGDKKVKTIMDLIIKYENMTNDYNMAYTYALNILNKWCDVYKDNNWTTYNVYKETSEFVYARKERLTADLVGAREYEKNEFEKYLGFDYLDAIKTRHSLRKYSNKPLLKEDIEYCINAAIQSPSACNRQMCYIYRIIDDQKKQILDDSIMGVGGLDKNNINYFVITFDISAFSFYGERNQGYLNAGLFAMNFVNALHFKGIGSCFLQWGNKHTETDMIIKKLEIPENEIIAVIVAAGYYPNKCKIPYSLRKKNDIIYKEI